MSKIPFLEKINAVYHGDDNLNGNPLLAMQMFQEELNKPCPKSYIKTDWRGVKSLPISYVEEMLDGYYLGNWSVTECNWTVINNEIVMSVTLMVVNPINQHVRYLVGTGGGAISVSAYKGDKKDIVKKSRHSQNLADFKIPNTLEGDFPGINSMCVKNAVKQLGRRFGRDINRKDRSDRNPNQLTETQGEEVNAALEALANRGKASAE